MGILSLEAWTLVHDFAQTLIWPLVVGLALYVYRDTIKRLLTQAKIKLAVSGVTIETSLTELEISVSEGLRGRKLTEDQWNWLRGLRDKGRTPYDAAYYDTLRPLRNAGLIKEHPEGWLTSAKEIEITTLGRLLIDAKDNR